MNLYLFTREKTENPHKRVWQEVPSTADDPITSAITNSEEIDGEARSDELTSVSTEEAADRNTEGDPENILEELEEGTEYELTADEIAAGEAAANRTINEPDSAALEAARQQDAARLNNETVAATAAAGAEIMSSTGSENSEEPTENTNENTAQTATTAEEPEETDWDISNISDRIPEISKANIDEIAWLEWAGEQIPEELKSSVHDDWVDHLRKNAATLKTHGQEEMKAEAKAYIEKNVSKMTRMFAKPMHALKQLLKMLGGMFSLGKGVTDWANSKTESDEALAAARDKIENPEVPGEEGEEVDETVAGTTDAATEAAETEETQLEETQTKVEALYAEKGIENGNVEGITNGNEYEQLSKIMNDNPDLDTNWYKAGLELKTLKDIAKYKDKFVIQKDYDGTWTALDKKIWMPPTYDLSKTSGKEKLKEKLQELDSDTETNNLETA